MSEDQEIDPEAVASFVRKAVTAIIVLAVIVTALGAYYHVNSGERAVVTRFGKVRGESGPGPHFKIPFIDAVHYYEVRTQAYTMSSSKNEGQKALRDDSIQALTSEGLNIKVDMTTRFHIQPSRVDYIYSNIGPNQRAVIERIVRPTARTAARSCSARYSVEGIYSSQRDDFTNCIREQIAGDFKSKGLVVEAIQVRNVMLPQKVRNAIQDKQATQQKVAQKRKELQIESLEKRRKVIEAQGIAKSNHIIGQSLTPQYLRWYWIQEGLQKGDAIYVPIGKGGMPIFKNVDSYDQSGYNGTANATPTNMTIGNRTSLLNTTTTGK